MITVCDDGEQNIPSSTRTIYNLFTNESIDSFVSLCYNLRGYLTSLQGDEMYMAKTVDSSKRVRRIIATMTVCYALIISVVTAGISVLVMNKIDDALKTKVSSMTSALNVQMKMNLDSYLSRIETTSTLVFAEEEAYLYDATKEGADGYEALSTEKIISDKLFDICIMENFVDFGIVYSNNHIVGKISNGTKELFGEALYTDLSSFINRQRTHDGWKTNYNDNYKRIYYVKRINENAVLVASFYTSELESVFEHPDGLGDITIRLAENNDVLIYSSVEGETGGTIPDEIFSRLNGQTSAAFMDDQYLITVNSCGDDWKVIGSVPTEIILKEKNEVQGYIIIIGIISAVIGIALSVLLSLRIYMPVDNMVSSLNKKAQIDLLTGVLNKRSFEERADMTLKNAGKDSRCAIILLDVDNFKGVNDTLGHSYGDKVLANIGNILRSVFRGEDILGRLGGDEFCVCIEVKSSDPEDIIRTVEHKCAQLCEAFHSNYTGDDNSYKISASIGASVCPDNGRSFSELYACADKALYNSKHKGKDTYTIYREELK